MEKLNMNQQYTLAAKRANSILGLICKTVAGRPRDLIHPSSFFGISKTAPDLPVIGIQEQVQWKVSEVFKAGARDICRETKETRSVQPEKETPFCRDLTAVYD